MMIYASLRQGQVIVIGTWTIFMFSVDGCISSISSASSCMVVACCLEAAAPPFPAFVLGYAVNGIGMALQVHSTLSRNFTRAYNGVYSMHKLMVSLQASGTMQRRRWACYTLHMVRINNYSMDASLISEFFFQVLVL
jgi:hypothetical protein